MAAFACASTKYYPTDAPQATCSLAHLFLSQFIEFFSWTFVFFLFYFFFVNVFCGCCCCCCCCCCCWKSAASCLVCCAQIGILNRSTDELHCPVILVGKRFDHSSFSLRDKNSQKACRPQIIAFEGGLLLDVESHRRHILPLSLR